VLSHDRALAVAAARSLASRITRVPEGPAPVEWPRPDRAVRRPAVLAERLSALARDLQRTSGTTNVLQRIVGAAVDLIPGVDAASISVATGRSRVESRVPSSELSRQIDDAQTQTGQGPCLDALHHHRMVSAPNLATDTRWPEFSRRAAALGAGSMLSFQLWVDEADLGALNLVSRTTGAFSAESETVGEMFAAHAAIAFAAAQDKEHLQSGFINRDLTGQATGIIMERFAIGAGHAFGLLVALSQDNDTTPYEAATQLVDTVARPDPTPLPPPPTRSGVRNYSAFDHDPLGMALTDPDGVLLTVNLVLARLLGDTPEHLTGTTLFGATHPDDLDTAVAAFSALREGPEASSAVEVRLRDGNGRWVRVSLSTATVLDEHGRVEHLVTQVEDVTAQHTLAEQLRHAAMHDPLTGLPNRTLFLQRLTHGADRPQAGAPLSVLFCHVDYFNAINNTHGHASGDTVLVALADRLRDALRPGDTAARLGGDEFAVICENTDADTAHTLADQLGTTLAAPLVVGQGTPDRATVTFTVSIGTATSNGLSPDPAALLHAADTAMYRDKNRRGQLR